MFPNDASETFSSIASARLMNCLEQNKTFKSKLSFKTIIKSKIVTYFSAPGDTIGRRKTTTDEQDSNLVMKNK